MTSLQNSSDDVIIVDWGTTNFRASLVASDGTVKDNVTSDRGISAIQGADFEAELMRVLAPWLDEAANPDVIALGMITSRNGWVEVPYVAVPATASDLAAGAVCRTLPNGSSLTFLPGITDPTGHPFPDVMRGEETQIVGHGLDRDGVLVLPGTHSKWARIKDGKIAGFQTFVTGEIFALISQHSFIAKSAPSTSKDSPDWGAFSRGVSAAQHGETGKNPFLTLLFSLRTGVLANQLTQSENLDYLSGLLIGYEFREALQCDRFLTSGRIAIVGNDGLNARYARVAQAFELLVLEVNEDAVISGALRVYKTGSKSVDFS